MTFSTKMPMTHVKLDREGAELVRADLWPSHLPKGSRFASLKRMKQLTLSPTPMVVVGKPEVVVYVVLSDEGHTVSVVERAVLSRRVKKNHTAWRKALGAKFVKFSNELSEGPAEQDEKGRLGLAPVPEGVRVSGPDPRGAEADLARLSQERVGLEGELKQASDSEKKRVQARIEWIDEVMDATSGLELAD